LGYSNQELGKQGYTVVHGRALPQRLEPASEVRVCFSGARSVTPERLCGGDLRQGGGTVQ
jgi:hypothetical protein